MTLSTACLLPVSYDTGTLLSLVLLGIWSYFIYSVILSIYLISTVWLIRLLFCFVKQYSGQTEVVAGAYRDVCLALLLELVWDISRFFGSFYSFCTLYLLFISYTHLYITNLLFSCVLILCASALVILIIIASAQLSLWYSDTNCNAPPLYSPWPSSFC